MWEYQAEDRDNVGQSEQSMTINRGDVVQVWNRSGQCSIPMACCCLFVYVLLAWTKVHEVYC